MGIAWVSGMSLRLSEMLQQDSFPGCRDKKSYKRRRKALQREVLLGQRGVENRRTRAVIVLEGFDASGKGGLIRRMVRYLDPRTYRVHPIGPPDPTEQKTHWLFRFWKRLPPPGGIAVFDRSWYGRVLVERVEGLAPAERIEQAYREIREFERQLTDDGVRIVKLFLGISREEQFRRFEARLADPMKQWKLSLDDVKARARWDEYVEAVDLMLERTHVETAPWNLIAADDKRHARIVGLHRISELLREDARWMERTAAGHRGESVREALETLEREHPMSGREIERWVA